jgi:hypothetical protein
MGTLKKSKARALVVHESGKSYSNSNQKSKGKKDLDPRKRSNFKPFDESSNSKAGKGKKGKSKCN